MRCQTLLRTAWLAASACASPLHLARDLGSWQSLAPIANAPRQEHAVFSLSSNSVGILGGVVPNGSATSMRTVDTVQLYSIADDTWSTVAPLPTPLNHPNAAVVDNRLYLLGGLGVASDGVWRAVSTAWVYDADADVWTDLPPIPDGLAAGSAAMGVYGNTIIAAGGLRSLEPVHNGEQDTVDSVLAFDAGSETWIDLPEAARRLPEPRDHAGGAVVGQAMYVVGGRERGVVNVRDSVFRLDLEDLSAGWTVGGEGMPTARGGIAAAVVGSGIFTFGGEGNPAAGSEGVFPDVEVYDTESETWCVLEPMQLPRHGTGAVAVDRAVYIPGGGVLEGPSAVDAFDVYQL